MGSVDWQINKAPLECTKYLLENEVNCDVNFRIGEDPENIKAQKLILCMRSPVFDRMFNGSFQESEKDPVIPDVTVGAFQALLRYCYYECLYVEDDMALPVLYASTKYMLPLLEKAARNKLKQILSQSNIWDIYGYAVSVGDQELHDACKDFFEGDITPVKEALQTEAFLTIPHELLLDFLHINDKAKLENACETSCHREIPRETKERKPYKNNFGISLSEIGLFNACNAWAKAECLRQGMDHIGDNMRTVLGEALFLLQLPTMLPKDLMTVVYPTGILTPEEMVNLGQYVHREPGSECQMKFPAIERKFVVTAPELDETPPNINTVFITSSERVMLTRVWTEGKGSFQVALKNEMSEVSLTMKCDSVYQGYRTGDYKLYYLDIKPQLLEPDVKYSLTLEQIKVSTAKQGTASCITMGKLSPFKEVTISKHPQIGNTWIYALTLCLV